MWKQHILELQYICKIRCHRWRDELTSDFKLQFQPSKSSVLPLMHGLALGLILLIYSTAACVISPDTQPAPWGYLFLCECLQLDMLIAAAHGDRVAGGMPSIFTISYLRALRRNRAWWIHPLEFRCAESGERLLEERQPGAPCRVSSDDVWRVAVNEYETTRS